MLLAQAFGRRIKTLRERRGLTQAELAEALERSVDAVSMIERGKNWPTIATIDRLASALDVPTTDLFDQLERGGENAATDQVAVAHDIIRSLSKRDLEVAIAMLEALKKSRPRRQT